MPDWTLELRRRLAAFDLPPSEESRIVEELSHHLDERMAELCRAGKSPPEARRLALDEISDDELRQGGWRALPIPVVAEPPPGAPTARWLEGIVRDVGYAIRSLSRQPGFAVAATLALALGIGATTAIVAAVDAVLLRPMPFPHADRLFVPADQNLARNIPRATVAFADAEDWRREEALFAGVAVWQQGAADLTGAGEPRTCAVRLRERTVLLAHRREAAGGPHADPGRSRAGRGSGHRDRSRALAGAVRRRVQRRRATRDTRRGAARDCGCPPGSSSLAGWRRAVRTDEHRRP